ncbi:MAG: CPBP family intramembrane metalloprotease, partial [Proteobacteria bacterium]|nr:CPBP family intramembrane metalloprotease [Pseudomonadota bacterium]
MTDVVLAPPARTLGSRPAFWIAFAAAAVVGLVTALKLFPVAMPIVNLDIKMSRAAALAAARERAAALKLAPPDARSAILFRSDGDAQNYIELEGGGKDAFGKLVAGNLFSPYTWEVRLFKAGSIPEVRLSFTPAGEPYGFVRRFAEDYVRDPHTKALTPEAARALGEARARADWGIDFAIWKPLEASQKTQPSGRVDHVFVYERAERMGEARFRLNIGVTGDELSGVARSVFIPQDFAMRYQAQRSLNNTIAEVAMLFAALAYGIGGCIVATLWLGRHGRLLPRPSFTAGGVVGGLIGLAMLSAIPASWFGFDTAQTETAFWARNVGGALAVMLGGGIALGLVFMAAEGLSRAAFPHQPQLWKLWSRGAGGSTDIAGRTAGGYLMVPVELGMIAAFYFVTNRYLGWWQPSSEMTDPNVLSSAVPALAPISMALQAGFMEECLFRAVPLSLGAIVGARFGARNAGIAIAFVLQALVFGAAHANYPGFPAYSRLVELVVPAMIWAAIFLRYGLLPTITLHALFDLTLMSIPLFLVEAPGAWLQRAIVIVAALVPALVVALRHRQARAWFALPATLFNGGWQPPAERVSDTAVAAPLARPTGAAARVQRMLPLAAVLALVAWFVATPLRTDVPATTISRTAAEAAADAALRAQGVDPATWVRSSSLLLAPDSGLWTMHRFVWQQAGAEAYHALIGKTLTPPLWDVRYARFDGDVAERAEDWHVTIMPDGSVRQVRHSLPEGRAGASLDRAAALALAEGAVQKRLGLDPATLKLVSANDSALPKRRDWEFTWNDPRVDVGKGGEARVQVLVAGDEVVQVGRNVFIPEAWLTDERAREGNWSIVKTAAGLLLALVGLAALVLGVRSFTRGQSDPRAGFVVGLVVAGSMLLRFGNGWPGLQFSLGTTDPVATQIALRVGGAAV